MLYMGKRIPCALTAKFAKDTESKRGQRMKIVTLWKLIGISVFAFGLGILVSFFLPDRALVVIETCIIVAIGLLFLLRPKC